MIRNLLLFVLLELVVAFVKGIPSTRSVNYFVVLLFVYILCNLYVFLAMYVFNLNNVQLQLITLHLFLMKDLSLFENCPRKT